MVGDLEKPLVVEKSANLRAFKDLDQDSLPVQWWSNKKILDDCWHYGGVTSWFQLGNEKPEQEGLALFWMMQHTVLHHLLTEIEKWIVDRTRQEKTVRNCVYWVASAAKEICSDTVRKFFAKAGFKEIEETDDDEENQPLNELADITEEGDDRAVDHEDNGENNDEEDESKQTVNDLQIKSYAEALCAVCDLQEFAASKNCPMLVELMQDATGLIEKVIIQKTVKQTIWRTFGRIIANVYITEKCSQFWDFTLKMDVSLSKINGSITVVLECDPCHPRIWLINWMPVIYKVVSIVPDSDSHCSLVTIHNIKSVWQSITDDAETSTRRQAISRSMKTASIQLRITPNKMQPQRHFRLKDHFQEFTVHLASVFLQFVGP
ncbi:hypothetical protein PR048_020318 [Dryococelus australis]|uniref:Uncharacterized protein n=1 Tax=Dryococelus australis TaxID=614101 RepID=A0ABQ9H5Y4_9NEOP|nr:hypothetical protein PR048_020318 [Dryococelus australis]